MIVECSKRRRNCEGLTRVEARKFRVGSSVRARTFPSRDFSFQKIHRRCETWRTISRPFFSRKTGRNDDVCISDSSENAIDVSNVGSTGVKGKKSRRSLALRYIRSTFSPHFPSINVKCSRLDAHHGSARQPARTSNRFFRSRIMPRLVRDLTVLFPLFFFLFLSTACHICIYFNTHTPRRRTAGKDSNVVITGFHHEHFNRGEMMGEIVQRGVLRENGAALRVCMFVCRVCTRGLHDISCSARYFTRNTKTAASPGSKAKVTRFIER